MLHNMVAQQVVALERISSRAVLRCSRYFDIRCRRAAFDLERLVQLVERRDAMHPAAVA